MKVFSLTDGVGHFEVPKTLTFKMKPSVKPFLWEWVLFAWEQKIIFITIASHLALLWNNGLGQLRNCLFSVVVRVLGLVMYMDVAGFCLVLCSHLRQIDSLVRKCIVTSHAHLSSGQRPMQVILCVDFKFGEGCAQQPWESKINLPAACLKVVRSYNTHHKSLKQKLLTF